MAERRSWLNRLVDVRRGEWRALTKAFVTLTLLITAHTALETARDALVLTRLPARELGVVYVAVAICVLPAVWLASRAAVRFGPQRALGGGLVTASVLLLTLFALPMNRATSVAVYVCGAVHRVGVYTLDTGSREVDAIAKAGGAAPNADLEQLNLAQPLSDGMKIDVPVKGQVIAQESRDSTGSTLDSTAAGAAPHRSGRHHSSRSSSHKLHEGQTVDVNTATESELTQLPGVGPSLASRIVEYRQSNGPFQTPDDLQNVSGIGPSKFAKMEPFIRI